MVLKTWIGVVSLACSLGVSAPQAHAAAAPAGTDQPQTAAAGTTLSRTEQHRHIAEEHITAHQAMTQAHIAGREPVSRNSILKPGARIFMPQTGERTVQNSIYGAQDPKDGSLKELKMFWRKIPDFGIKQFEIFPTEKGWVQVLKWSGTGQDGKLYSAQEAGLYETDADFKVVRAEIYSDTGQWMAVAAYAMDRDPKTFTVEDYFAAVAGS